MGHKAREAACIIPRSPARNVSLNELAMDADAGYISVGCPEGNELTFSPLSYCTLYALLIIEYTFHTFYSLLLLSNDYE